MNEQESTRYYAKDVCKKLGTVAYLANNSQITEDFCLTGAIGGGFLDFSSPVLDTSSYLNTIPPKKDGCIWKIHITEEGYYRLTFRYNNPGFQMGGDRNMRDERNCRVTLTTVDGHNNRQDYWLGWLIFNVSGYNQFYPDDPIQEYRTIAGNTCWNQNFMHCYLPAGDHELQLVLEAPPGQAVYDGPNIDYLEIARMNSDFIRDAEVPYLPTNHPFKHDGLLLRKARSQELAKRYQAQESKLCAILAKLKETKLGKLDYQPNPVSFIDVGPYNNPNIGGEEWTQDCIAAHYQAVLWAITKETQHGEKAIEILNSWWRTLETVASGNDLKLRFSLVGLDLLAAAEIIRYWYNKDSSVTEDKKWQEQDIAGFEQFLQQKIYHKTREFYPQANGNWDAIIGAFNLAVCIFCEDVSGVNQCLRQVYLGNAVTTYALSMGALPNYLSASGESQESNRDQVHARMGLTGLCHQAWIVAGQGIDLFQAYEERLLVGVKYNATYQLGKKVPSQTFISDRGRGTVDIASTCYAIILSWYRNRGAELADIQEAKRLTLNQQVKNEAKFVANDWLWLVFG